MNKLKEINVIIIIVITLLLLPTTICQFSDSSSTLDLISDGIKAIFGIDQVLKTLRKVSSVAFPFQSFVPIFKKPKFIDLLRGKKFHNEEFLQLYESPSQLDPIVVPAPESLIIPNPNNQQFNEYPFYNMRPTNIDSEFPAIENNGFTAQPSSEEDMKQNGLDLDYMQNEVNDNYSERYENSETEIPQDLEQEETVEDQNNPILEEVAENWDTIDYELRRIGFRLGKLGQILDKN